MADQIKVNIEGKTYYVVGGQFQDMLTAVKQVDGRRFVSDTKAWQLPGTVQEVQNQIEASGYQLEAGKSAPSAPAKVPTTQGSAAARGGQDRIRIMYQNQQLTVVGGTFQDMLAVVKNLPNRRFDGERKVWEVSGDLLGIQEMLAAAGFQLEGADKIAADVPQRVTPPKFSATPEPPPYEEPDFYGDDDIPPYEPPDWWDDKAMPLPAEPVGEDWYDAPANDELFPADDSAAAPAGGKTRGADQIRIRLGGIPLVITGGSFQEMLVVIKNLPGRRFHGEDKVWDIPDTITLDALRQKMDAAGFTVQRG